MNLSTKELEEKIRSYSLWFYNFNLNGIETSPETETTNRRHGLRHDLFIQPLVDASYLKGKRVLDIGCCSGYWSFKAVEAGAEYVLAVDAWPEAIEQARLVADIWNIPSERCKFVLDDAYTLISNEELDGQFDIILCLGFFYHIKKPIELLERMHKITKDLVILDTMTYKSDDALISLRPDAGKQMLVTESARDRLVFVPSEKAVHWMMDEVGFKCETIKDNFETRDNAIIDYYNGERMSFVLSKGTEISSIYNSLKDKPEPPPETLIEFLRQEKIREMSK
jgi:2-polyprenyl-3-methyl-5-hydroxy-6-metoxy-1,4-benzoquinol methylase